MLKFINVSFQFTCLLGAASFHLFRVLLFTLHGVCVQIYIQLISIWLNHVSLISANPPSYFLISPKRLSWFSPLTLSIFHLASESPVFITPLIELGGWCVEDHRFLCSFPMHPPFQFSLPPIPHFLFPMPSMLDLLSVSSLSTFIIPILYYPHPMGVYPQCPISSFLASK